MMIIDQRLSVEQLIPCSRETTSGTSETLACKRAVPKLKNLIETLKIYMGGIRYASYRLHRPSQPIDLPELCFMPKGKLLCM